MPTRLVCPVKVKFMVLLNGCAATTTLESPASSCPLAFTSAYMRKLLISEAVAVPERLILTVFKSYLLTQTLGVVLNPNKGVLLVLEVTN